MKKYIYCVAMAMLTMTLLTGCGAGIELSDEENDMIAEYMAAALLKYDAHYEDALIYAEAAETPEDDFKPVDSVEEEQKSDVEDIVDVTGIVVNDILGDKKYQVEYLGVEEHESYSEPGNEYYVVDAPSGCKLVVVQFDIKNIAEEDILVALADKGITYELVLGGNTSSQPLLTALMNGLQYYNEAIPKGESKVGVILFAVDKDVDVSQGAVVVKGKEGTSCRVPLK